MAEFAQELDGFGVGGVVAVGQGRSKQFFVDGLRSFRMIFSDGIGEAEPQVVVAAAGRRLLPGVVVIFFPKKDLNQTRVIGRTLPPMRLGQRLILCFVPGDQGADDREL